MFVRIRHSFGPEAVESRIRDFPGLDPYVIHGVNDIVIAVVGDIIEYPELESDLQAMKEVAEVGRISTKYKLSGRAAHPEQTIVNVSGIPIGDGHVVVIAGPCAVENEEQTMATARAVKAAGAALLRGGAFKPRSSFYDFQGLGEDGLKILVQARDETGLPIVTEVMGTDEVELVAKYADMLQIGTRNAQNFNLLVAVAQTGKPVLLKRGMSSRIEEWLQAADYLLKERNPNVVLCERGIRTFETATRNTTDVNAIALVRELSHLPVIGDPSHATGKASLVPPIALSMLAAGADGLIIEVHPRPEHARSDGAQSLTPKAFRKLMRETRRVTKALRRPLV